MWFRLYVTWLGLLGLLLLGGWGTAGEQRATVESGAALSTDTLERVRFEEARALAVDPRGRLYVADAGRDAVVVLSPDGRTQATLGGTGMRAGQFLGPADIDPTNGQTLFVADAGNGRLQRFSEELQYLESLPVGRGFDEGHTLRAFDDGRDGSEVQGDGRPIAVRSSVGNHTFAIDGRAGVVLKWDEQRRPEQVIGGGARRAGRLERPVALALEGSRRLFVADQEREAVLVYDRFGTFEQELPTPPLSDIRALTFRRGRLWIVCPDRVFVWHSTGGRVAEHPIDLPAPLVDVAPFSEGVYLLTSTRLRVRDALR